MRVSLEIPELSTLARDWIYITPVRMTENGFLGRPDIFPQGSALDGNKLATAVGTLIPAAAGEVSLSYLTPTVMEALLLLGLLSCGLARVTLPVVDIVPVVVNPTVTVTTAA